MSKKISAGTIYRSADRGSALVLPVMEGTDFGARIFMKGAGGCPANLKCVLQGLESADQLSADVVDAGDDHHRNAGSNKAVFDRRRAGLVLQKTPHQIQHWVPLFLFAAEARRTSRGHMVKESLSRLTMNDQKVTIRISDAEVAVLNIRRARQLF
jgi:hypothetical protein